jgi:hypothetical protein
MNRSMSLVAGLVLLGLGGFVLLRGANFTTRENVVKLGDVQITAKEKQTVPPWAGGIAVAAGVLLLAAGAKKRA